MTLSLHFAFITLCDWKRTLGLHHSPSCSSLRPKSQSLRAGSTPAGPCDSFPDPRGPGTGSCTAGTFTVLCGHAFSCRQHCPLSPSPGLHPPSAVLLSLRCLPSQVCTQDLVQITPDKGVLIPHAWKVTPWLFLGTCSITLPTLTVFVDEGISFF